MLFRSSTVVNLRGTARLLAARKRRVNPKLLYIFRFSYFMHGQRNYTLDNKQQAARV